MPRSDKRTDVRAEIWLNKTRLREAKREAKRRGMSRKMLLEVAACEGLEVLQKEKIQELPLR